MSNSFRNTFISGLVLLITISCVWWFLSNSKTSQPWSTAEISILRTLWIGSLPEQPNDASNEVVDHPLAKQLGHELFFDKRFSHNGEISCATCHKPELYFTDGLKLAAGAAAGVKNTMTIVGMGYSPWLFWDGRKDSLWAQALSPLETSIEHAGTRTQYAHIISQDTNYKTKYESLFGALPNLSDSSRFPLAAGPVDKKEWRAAWQAMSAADRNHVTEIFVNMGKALAAYQRLLLPGPSKFDRYVESIINNTSEVNVLSNDEIAGLRLFIGKAQCVNCHNGPLFTNSEFHNTATLSSPRQLPSMGRVVGVRAVLEDPFNCLGQYNNSIKKDCAELRFAKQGDDLIGAHKTPSLRNVAQTKPYMHAGQIDNLKDVIDHYNRAPIALVGHNEAKPLKLSRKQRKQLLAFLLTLSGPLATESKWLVPPHG